jgi:predicted phosphoribosyltransferase
MWLGDFLKKMSFLDPVIIALPKGGVIIGHAVASSMHCSLSFLMISEIETPSISPNSVSLKGREVIVVDDGFATGVTAAKAGKFLRGLGPSKLILAVPLGPVEVPSFLQDQYDNIFCQHPVVDFLGVSEHYEHYPQVDVEDVSSIMESRCLEDNISAIPRFEKGLEIRPSLRTQI